MAEEEENEDRTAAIRELSDYVRGKLDPLSDDPVEQARLARDALLPVMTEIVNGTADWMGEQGAEPSRREAFRNRTQAFLIHTVDQEAEDWKKDLSNEG